MDPRRSLSFAAPGLVAGALVLALGCGDGRTADSAERPNVLLLVVDALRADALGVNGYPLPTTPHLDALAAEGVSLPNVHAHSTWTKPSMATLFTSLYPPQHGLEHVAEQQDGVLATGVLLDDVVTLAEELRAAGYRSGAVLDQVHLQARFGFDQGFDGYAELRGSKAPRLNRQVLSWIDMDEERPFFAWVHYLDVHWPYDLRVKGRGAHVFGDPGLPSRPPNRSDAADRWAAEVGPEAARALRARYDAEIAWTDAAIGELLDGLHERGRLENTLVIVTSDHGEAFMERGHIQHGREPYRELTHVPLVLRPPVGWEPFEPFGGIVGLVDVMPTLLELLGLEVPATCQGRSFAAALRGARLAPRLHYAEGAGVVAVRSADRTLLYFDEDRFDLYDAAADPRELEPVHWACDGPCDRLLRGARTYRTRLQRRVKPRGRVLEALTAEDLAELRSLGYL